MAQLFATAVSLASGVGSKFQSIGGVFEVALATAVFGHWHSTRGPGPASIGMPAFDALADSILRGQQAEGSRATDDRQRQLFVALEARNTQIIRFGAASVQLAHVCPTAPRRSARRHPS